MANHQRENKNFQYSCKLLLYFFYLYDIENITILISQVLGECCIIRNVKPRRLIQNLVYPKVVKLN